MILQLVITTNIFLCAIDLQTESNPENLKQLLLNYNPKKNQNHLQ